MNLGSFEKSVPLATTSMARRDTRSRSLPLASSWANSVIAGTWRNSRRASKRRCSIEPADQGSCVVQPSWLSISLTNWLILAAGGLRLLTLDTDQRCFVLLIIEEHVENAVG